MIFQINNNINITTSRKPSQKTRRLAQFLKHYFNFNYINRGKTSLSKLKNQTQTDNKHILIIINETKGNPSSINIYDLNLVEDEPVYSLYINVSLPENNTKINVNSKEIYILNKAKSMRAFNELFKEVKPEEKLKTNIVTVLDYKENDNIAKVEFIDKHANTLKYKLYIKSFKINIE